MLLVIGGLSGYIPFTQIAGWTWNLLLSPVPVPLVVLLALVGSLVWAGLGVLQRAMVPRPPPWLAYREDIFLGIKWRWDYIGHEFKRSSLMPFCPRCGVAMRIESGGYRTISTRVICDECPLVQEIEGNWEQVFDRVCRLLVRRVEEKYDIRREID